MKILYLTIAYPKIKENSNLYSDLANEFGGNGHELYVVAPRIDDLTTNIEKEGTVKVLRVKTMPLFNVGSIKKGIANIIIPFQFINAIKKHLSDICFDLIISPTPPITLHSVIKFVKNRDDAKSYLILRDIFPQNAKDLGIMTNRFLFLYFRKFEKKMYEISDFIGCMSKGNIAYVTKHNQEIEKSKFHLLPNWIKVEDFKIASTNLKKRYGLDGKYVAVFGGNLGKPQYVDFILDLAKAYLNNTNIVFLIIGDGTEQNRIKRRVDEENILNVILKNSIPRSDFLELIKQCNVGLVNLHPAFTIPNIPSRMLAYFQAGIPILAAIDRNTDFGEILDDSKSGVWCYSNDLEDYKRKFDLLYSNEEFRKELGLNGYNYLKNYLDVSNAYKIIVKNAAL